MITISICLSDLPKEKITTAKNGKKYISLTMWENQTPDKYGNDFALQVSRTAEERKSGVKAIYVGNGKNLTKPVEQPKTATEQLLDDDPFKANDDLPF